MAAVTDVKLRLYLILGLLESGGGPGPLYRVFAVTWPAGLVQSGILCAWNVSLRSKSKMIETEKEEMILSHSQKRLHHSD